MTTKALGTNLDKREGFYQKIFPLLHFQTIQKNKKVWKNMMKKTATISAIVLCLIGIILAFNMSVFAAEQTISTDPALEIEKMNLSFRDAICIKYAIPVIEGVEDKNVKLLVWTAPQNNYVYDASSTSAHKTLDWVTYNTISGVKYMIFDYTGLAAKQMTDVLYARAYAVTADGREIYSDVKSYSILQYAYRKLGKLPGKNADPDENLRTLLEDMLVYGSSAQKYTKYNLTRLAVSDYYYLSVNGGTFGTGVSDGLFLTGETITLKAPETNTTGETFAYWQDDQQNIVGTKASCEVIVGNTHAVYTPVYNESPADETYTVVFKDWDGSVLKTQVGILRGEEAFEPATPIREGYIFSGWDKTFDSVIGNLTVTATYTKLSNLSVVVNPAAAEMGATTVDVVISIANNPGLTALKLNLDYDSEILTLKTISFDSRFGDYVTAPMPYADPQTMMFISPMKAIAINGNFAVLTFEISSSVTKDVVTEIGMTYAPDDTLDENLNPIAITVISGEVSINRQ